jgi:hypothetical protein
MSFTRKNILKVGLATFGAILISAVGSGLWEGLVGPALRTVRNWILDTISLMFLGFKNAVYIEIARDHPSAVSMATHSLLLVLFVLVWVATVGYLAGRIRGTKDNLQELARRIDEARQGKAREQSTPARIDAQVGHLLGEVKAMSKVLYSLIATLVFF